MTRSSSKKVTVWSASMASVACLKFPQTEGSGVYTTGKEGDCTVLEAAYNRAEQEKGQT